MRHARAAAAFSLLLVCCAGCPSFDRDRTAAAEPLVRPPAPPRVEEVVLGQSVQGRDLAMTIFRGGPASVLVIGGVHGNEQTSVDVASGLLELLRDQPELAKGRTVAIFPNSNPDGYARNSRYNANRIDVNRNFDAKNFKPAMQAGLRSGTAALSEPEARAIVRAIEMTRPALLISIHSASAGRHCNNWDGPAEHVAELMSKHNGYPPAATMGYPTPGSLGSYAGVDRQIPMITLELPRDVPGAQAWADNRDALMAAIAQTPDRAAALAKTKLATDGAQMNTDKKN
jgi:protein MpaA